MSGMLVLKGTFPYMVRLLDSTFKQMAPSVVMMLNLSPRPINKSVKA
jgi:hypothetical protein